MGKAQRNKTGLTPSKKAGNELLALDGTTIPVKFKVSKYEPKIDIDLS
jgi:hypothetical protein